METCESRLLSLIHTGTSECLRKCVVRGDGNVGPDADALPALASSGIERPPVWNESRVVEAPVKRHHPAEIAGSHGRLSNEHRTVRVLERECEVLCGRCRLARDQHVD